MLDEHKHKEVILLTFLLDVGGCARLSLSGGLRAALYPRIGLYLPLVTLANDATSACKSALGFRLSFSRLVV